jgi:hypothetical protein
MMHGLGVVPQRLLGEALRVAALECTLGPCVSVTQRLSLGSAGGLAEFDCLILRYLRYLLWN